MGEVSASRKDNDGVEWGRCPCCLRPRPGNKEKPEFGLSFAEPCAHCGYDFIPEQEPVLAVWVCPYCARQHPNPNDSRDPQPMARCWHKAGPDAPRVTGRLVRVEVAPLEPFERLPLPSEAKAPQAQALRDKERKR